jgi:hypothetical protein
MDTKLLQSMASKSGIWRYHEDPMQNRVFHKRILSYWGQLRWEDGLISIRKGWGIKAVAHGIS